MTPEKVIIVKKKTQLEELLRRHATTSQVKFFLERRGESYQFYQEAHQQYQRSLQEIISTLPHTVRQQTVEKEHLSTFQFSDKDVIVAVGDPGLFVNVAKYVGEQPVIVINPDVQRYDDTFTSCSLKDFSVVLQQILKGEAEVEALTMAEARLEDGQTLYGLNDLFIGRNSHVSARYEISFDGKQERQSSSGIIVSTGTGSTGWLTSVMVGSYSLAARKLPTLDEFAFLRDADYLVFAVREPFPSRITGTTIVHGQVTVDNPLRIMSQMPENGVIFSDGIESDYLEFNSGRNVIIQPAEKKVYRVCGTK